MTERNMGLIPENLKERLSIIEDKISTIEDLLIGKNSTMSLGEVRGLITKKHIERLNRKLNNK
tara:strand:- start:6778 stop:6966 length:189 start_codon:yes stop_codon:yes gene_type:complete